MVVPNMSNHPKREYVLKLMAEKDKIELQIRELTQILTANNVGMTDPLVDNEGFPLSTVDVYQVRHARHKIICLQNDHKALMKQIESGLHEIYGTSSDGESSATASGSTDVDMEIKTEEIVSENIIPIAKVNMIREGSPADIDGVRLNDLIVEFGSINASNFQNLTDIARVAQHSQGMPLLVKVLRNSRIVHINLTPRLWVGRGLLGCNIIPLENVDR